jgi:hypothetical protein
VRQRFCYLTMAMIGGSLPVLGSIQYTCDPDFSTYAPAGICTSPTGLNGSSVSGVYSSIFSNVNANIYITFGGTNAYGQSTAPFTPVSYLNYYNALTTHTDDPVALASLGGNTDPLGSLSNGNIDVSPALANALGLTDPSDNGATTNGVMSDGVTPCTLGPSNPNCYNGVINMGEPGVTGTPWYFPLALNDPPGTGIDFYLVVEHETDEILGTISCIAGDDIDGCQPATQSTAQMTDASPADLFRYAAPGVRTFLNASDGTTSAYFSIDGGLTDIADYNNSPTGGDYGDWLSIYPYMVQDAQVSPEVNLDISTDVGVNSNHYPRPEVAVLDAVGFNLNSSAPEPGTLGLLGGSLVLLALVRARVANRRPSRSWRHLKATI